MASGKATAEEMLGVLRTTSLEWDKEVALFHSIRAVLAEVRDCETFLLQTGELSKRLSSLRSGYVAELLRFFREIVQHFQERGATTDGLVERVVLSEEMARCLCSANKVIFIKAAEFLDQIGASGRVGERLLKELLRASKERLSPQFKQQVAKLIVRFLESEPGKIDREFFLGCYGQFINDRSELIRELGKQMEGLVLGMACHEAEEQTKDSESSPDEPVTLHNLSRKSLY